MTQHFLLSRPAKTMSLAQVFRMTDTEAEAMFRKVRWPETDGAPVCPHCGGLNAYVCRRQNGLLRFRCRACRENFTITSGTLSAFHKLPLRGYLAAIAIFCNEVLLSLPPSQEVRRYIALDRWSPSPADCRELSGLAHCAPPAGASIAEMAAEICQKYFEVLGDKLGVCS
jgi:Transposase zinc-ribbon domain